MTRTNPFRGYTPPAQKPAQKRRIPPSSPIPPERRVDFSSDEIIGRYVAARGLGHL